MRGRMLAIKTLAVGGMIIALSGAALGADMLTNASGSESVNTSDMTAASHATVNADLPAAAASVIASLVGGTNPSTSLKSEHASNATTEQATNTTTEQATNNEDETEADNDVEQGHGLGQTGTAGTKPGWGCGDKNHTHSGPPGNPSATSPCNKH